MDESCPEFAQNREWCGPEADLSLHSALAKNWQYSRKRIAELRDVLAAPPAEVQTLAIAGSLGRMEGSPESDGDLVVVLRPGRFRQGLAWTRRPGEGLLSILLVERLPLRHGLHTRLAPRRVELHGEQLHARLLEPPIDVEAGGESGARRQQRDRGGDCADTHAPSFFERKTVGKCPRIGRSLADIER